MGAVPALGQHTAAVLLELGVGAARARRVAESGVLGVT